MKINSNKELQEYLHNVNWSSKQETELSCVYFLVTYNGQTQSVYFTEYDGTYLESDNELRIFELDPEKLESYVRDRYKADSFEKALAFEKTMQRGNQHYEIMSYENLGFLPEKLDDIQMISETECLDWILEHYIKY